MSSIAFLSGEADSRTAVIELPAPIDEWRRRPVLVTGAAGMVGSHVCRELTRRGWRVRAMVRDPVKAATRLAHLPVDLCTADIRDAAALHRAMHGCGAVVHLAAIAIERPDQSYEEVNTDGTRAVIYAAKTAYIERLVHMSQNGAHSGSPHRFLRSKGLAEDAVVASGLAWTVLRPSVIFGREDEFVNVLARLVRLSPVFFPLPGGGQSRFQPVAVHDVARAVAAALEQRDVPPAAYALGGPTPLTLREMARRILRAMRASRILIGVPVSVLRPLVSLAARTLPNPPMTPGLLDLLGVENTVPDNALPSVFHITPTPFAPEELTYLRTITAGEALQSLLHR